MTLEQALDYESFAAWLGSYQDMAIGIPGQPAACPLAVYLRATLSLEAISVSRTHVKAARKTIPLPVWAAQFVKAVDGQTAALTGDEATNILLLALEKGRRAETQEPRRSVMLNAVKHLAGASPFPRFFAPLRMTCSVP